MTTSKHKHDPTFEVDDWEILDNKLCPYFPCITRCENKKNRVMAKMFETLSLDMFAMIVFMPINQPTNIYFLTYIKIVISTIQQINPH